MWFARNLKLLFSIILLLTVAGIRAQEVENTSDSLKILVAQDNPDALDSLKIIETQKGLYNRKFSVSAYPFLFYRPETQLAAGVGGVFVFYTSEDSILKPSKVESSFFYTTNDQFAVKIKSGIFFLKNKIYIETPVTIGRTVDKFWGVGPNTPETGNEPYMRKDFDVNLLVQAPPVLFYADMTGLNFEYNKTVISDIRNNELINDSLSGAQGGSIFGIGINLLWDRRDHLFYPTRGNYQTFNFVFYPEPSDFVFYKFELDVRYYLPISSSMVFASNLYYHTVKGDVPFYKLPALGGQYRMRGYFQGRYRGDNLVVLQGEFRHFFAKRWGYVVFAGVGEVSEYLTKMQGTQLKYSLGGGLRYLFNKKEKINVRFDVGYSKNGDIGVYFGLTEAF